VTSFETTTVEIHCYATSYVGAETVSVVDVDWFPGIDGVEVPARLIVDTRTARKRYVISNNCDRVGWT